MTEREAIRRLDGNEDEAVRQLRALLQSARAELVRQILSTPGEFAAVEVLVAMRVALDRAMVRVQGGAVETLASRMARALTLGTALADSALPTAFLATYSLNPFVLAQLTRRTSALVSGITEPLRNQIDNAVRVGFLAGKTPREVARDIAGTGIEPAGPFRTAQARASAIARTELNRISNTATWERGREAAERLPGLRKEWLAATDARTRPSHRAANGQTVGMDEDFTVGGEACSHPLDPRLSAGNVVHCRCRMILRVEEDD